MPFDWASFRAETIVSPATGMTQIASTWPSCTHCWICCSCVEGSPFGSAVTTVSPCDSATWVRPSASPLRAGTWRVKGENPIFSALGPAEAEARLSVPTPAPPEAGVPAQAERAIAPTRVSATASGRRAERTLRKAFMVRTFADRIGGLPTPREEEYQTNRLLKSSFGE